MLALMKFLPALMTGGKIKGSMIAEFIKEPEFKSIIKDLENEFVKFIVGIPVADNEEFSIIMQTDGDLLCFVPVAMRKNGETISFRQVTLQVNGHERKVLYFADIVDIIANNVNE